MVNNKTKIENLERGSIIKISFDPSIGHEQSGYRPALVLSDREFHKITGFAFCIPITSKKKDLLFEVEVKANKISGVLLLHGSKILDLSKRKFSFIEKASNKVTENAQIIISKIITE
jgi:mRNA interferase MazF